MSELRGLKQLEPRGGVGSQGFELRPLGFQGSLELDQQSGRALGESFDDCRGACLILDRAQSCSIHNLKRLRASLTQGHNRFGGSVEIGEEQQAGVLYRKLGNGVEDSLGDEGQSAFRADQQVGKDIDGALEVEEGVDAVTGGVLGAIFAADALGERRVILDSRLEFEDTACQRRFAGKEELFGVRRSRVNGRAGGKQESQRGERVVGVLLDAATHAAGVIRENSSQRAGCDRGRVGADLGAVREQHAIGAGADSSGPDANPAPIFEDLEIAKVARDFDQQTIGDGLAGEAGASGAEGDGEGMVMAELEEPRYFFFIGRLHHRLGNQPVEAGIRGVCNPVDGAHQNALRIENLGQHGGEFLRRVRRPCHCCYRHFVCSRE